MIQVTANDTRDAAQKRALDAAIARHLAREPGIAPGNVFVDLVEVARDNRSFGEGPMRHGPLAPD